MPMSIRPETPPQAATVVSVETFGNEGFWTDALRLPQGIAALGGTPVTALQVGLSLDSDAIAAAFRGKLS